MTILAVVIFNGHINMIMISERWDSAFEFLKHDWKLQIKVVVVYRCKPEIFT